MNGKEPNIGLALVPLVILIGAAAMSIFVWDAGMFIPLISGIAAASLIGKILGYQWRDLQGALSDGVSKALPAVFILFIIGTIIGTWILSGVIPTLIYYGLAMINPNFFVPLVCFITGIVALVLGSSFTSIATVGLAFIAIGQGMDFPLPLVAGAVISGAFFGDKLSPLSDTTNVAPAMVGEDLFAHVRYMLWDTIPAFVISLLLYWIVGLNYATSTASVSEINEMMQGLDALFVIHPLLFAIPVFTFFLMLKQYPAIPSLVLIAVIGGITAILVQGSNITQVVQAMTAGYQAESGIEAIDSLLSRGGINSMLNTIGLIIIATALGGVLESTGVFKVIVNTIVARVHSTGSLILSTVLSTFVVAFASGAQFLAIILPARGFLKSYKNFALSPLNLSRSVEAAGTVGINLVPWGVPAVFAAGVFGVPATEFIPFIFFAFLVPLINIVYGYTGFAIKRIPATNYEKKEGMARNVY
ncbi:Na+/H+ antiporter NhaC [Virgibacillus alimentarius]|uniref:NhaC family Na+:H+ antiporter n=1 Tax=Virgibacillus alimentarius TaxID=698769 RepID=A0ABS4S9M9_9BACI|nr:Na+/H+ antiporter NhaC [Virgibacillus alimentarius]MBP2258216.1 NhaC family Na+:H+ antiporter [Virgibacillus alimentarius]